MVGVLGAFIQVDLDPSHLAVEGVVAWPVVLRHERAAFAWFFLSGKFDEAASIERLDRALAFGADVGRDARAVVRGLADAAPRHLGPAVRCLDKIARKILAGGLSSSWRIMAIDEGAIWLLTAARSRGDQETRRIARELANVLVAHGHRDFETGWGREHPSKHAAYRPL